MLLLLDSNIIIYLAEPGYDSVFVPTPARL
uniref:Uncharacterized protein n=1 Tax=Candidatus Kentrum sp. FM TaxID=2126340 RepID=A0A450TX88_9GAMM|nr:MAG: hypothetical protein BECKFM1743C_GA0114222_106384 [Candidatus Kentron sp. FM]VFJ73873.1 MAG: hypothetical protein BECKFM1743A_GA0114220_107442 [Candidatus Kentron sp. FM]VFK22097.1 MAG: hypothetical protein BECKFM1743B_GA0114221_108392 [Candidatus Kentron sp. FM]